MTFARVEMLFLIWVVPLLLLVYFYGWRKRRILLERFADPRALAGLVPPGIQGRRRLRAAVVLAAALLLVVALAGPQYGFQWQTVERQGVDLIIALDCSRSMLAQDIQPTRLDRAKREIVDLLSMLQGDRVGLVAFSGSAFLQCPLTVDYNAFDLFLNVLTPDYLPMGGTDLGAALQTALAAFNTQSVADKAIILITDGEHTGRGDPEAAAQAAQKAGVKLFCIGVGSAEGVPVPMGGGGFQKGPDGQIVMTRLDEPLLTRMAVATGGTYVRSVAGDMDLDTIYYEHIRGEMAGATVESGRRQVWADRYQWPLALAIALLMAALAIPPVKPPLAAIVLALAILAPPAPSLAGPLQEGYRAYQEGRYDQAQAYFLKGRLDDPDNPQVLYNLGNAYYKKGDYAAAAAHYSQALARADAALKAQLLYNLGNSAYRQGALPEAVRNYEAALKLTPEDTQAKENLAFVEKKLQQQQQQKSGEASKDNTSSQTPQEQNPSSAQAEQGKDKDQGAQAEPSQAQSQPKATPSASQAGSQMDQQAQPPAGGSEQEQPAQAQAAQDTSAQEQASDRPPMAPGAADQMLNRLKDAPGRALMPHYGKQPVEKDW